MVAAVAAKIGMECRVVQESWVPNDLTLSKPSSTSRTVGPHDAAEHDVVDTVVDQVLVRTALPGIDRDCRRLVRRVGEARVGLPAAGRP
jgi:hypothetical protein